MIRHCVFIRFGDNVEHAHKESLFQQLEALQSRLEGMLAFHAGVNVSPEDGMDKGFSDGFMIDFSTAEARDAYLLDAEHQAIGAQLVEAAVEGVAGILVYDMEIDPGC